jgi:hypothetical protein
MQVSGYLIQLCVFVRTQHTCVALRALHGSAGASTCTMQVWLLKRRLDETRG